MITSTILERGATFLSTHARVVDRRVFERVFAGATAEPVVAAIAAYRNADGGFGHALEADLRTPRSQPVHTDTALSLLLGAGTNDASLVTGACEFLSSVADENGAVPNALPSAADHAHAAHWQGDFAFAPSLHATSGVAARLHALGAQHEWLDQATAWCIGQVAGHPSYSGHGILNAMAFVEYLPDRERAAALWQRVEARLFEADYVILETPLTGYGLTPLWFARTPSSRARALFDDAVIEAHLDELQRQQQSDGGWPISWSPPGPAAVLEWRGRWTVEALMTLRAYGRI